MTDLWAITTFFNPFRYESKLSNYRVFRSFLSVPLVTVELSYDGGYDLASDDADRLIQIPGHDVLWQKDRLLNVALEHLPASCDAVAWIDCDVVFRQPDWPGLAIYALANAPLVQLFRRIHHLRPETDPANASPVDALFSEDSFAYRHMVANMVGTVHRGEGDSYTPGVAWAARREVITDHGFYDACIVGGGDTALAFATIGRMENAVGFHFMNPRQREYYFSWGRRFHEKVLGRIDYLNADLFHLWHGSVKDRRYLERHKKLRRFNFDPYVDLALSQSGAWSWGSAKPQMHLFLEEYFKGRREDDR